jgi:hypothetical protein
MGAMNQIALEVQNYVALREALKVEFADIDDETLGDTLEGLTDVRAIVAGVARSSLADEVMASALKQRIDEMRERLGRIEAGRERKRELALTALCKMGVQKLVEPDFTASVKSGAPVVDIIDEMSVPKEFWVPQDPKLNRGAIYKALKGGSAVPGAMMEQGAPVLSIRRT